MLKALDRGTLHGLRDRAVLLLGFAGGPRRAEVIGLDVGRDQTDDGRGWIEILDRGFYCAYAARPDGARSKSAAARPTPPALSWRWRPDSSWRASRTVPSSDGSRQGKAVGTDQLNDLVKRAALPAGVRGNLPEDER